MGWDEDCYLPCLGQWWRLEVFVSMQGLLCGLVIFLVILKGLHFLEKYKFESTIGQQMKLIDYLQALYEDNNSNKKKKVDSPSQLANPGCPARVSHVACALVAASLQTLHFFFLFIFFKLYSQHYFCLAFNYIFFLACLCNFRN